MSFIGLIIGCIGIVYIGLWWYGREEHSISFGISFSHTHAAELTSDWKKMYQDMLAELRPPFVRIAAQWDEIEVTEGVYDFASVDFMMEEALKNETKILLVVGQKIPRWPECFIPGWAEGKNTEDYQKKLTDYVRAVVDRYKNHEALEYWQVENEPFIKFDFGKCEHFDAEMVDKEIELVRGSDSDHKIVLTDSGEMSTWRQAAKKSDILGTTLYRVVRTPKGSVFTYDALPAGFYRAKALVNHVSSDRFFISELQAEPWYHEGTFNPVSSSVANDTLDISRMKKNFEFARHTGASRAYVWGVEWWYWAKYTHNDTSFIDAAKEYIRR